MTASVGTVPVTIAAVRLAGAARAQRGRPSGWTRLAAVARLEFGDVRRARWLVFCCALYTLLALLFLAIGLRESDVIEFTGMSRLLASLSHALVLLLPLLALIGSGLAITRARESGALELLLSQPISRGDYFLAITIVRFGVLVAPMAVLVGVLAVIGRTVLGQELPWAFLVRVLAVCTALLWAFTGIGLAISTVVRESSRAIVYLIAAWATAVALLDFGLIGAMLQWRLPPQIVFAIAAANPVESARLALLAGADRSLETLGPVGVFLTERFGTGLLLGLGIAWPAAVGTLAWVAALRIFRRGEVV
jgi:ABC-type transport system involved in multi-copper enzyme maturation permease subunit